MTEAFRGHDGDAIADDDPDTGAASATDNRDVTDGGRKYSKLDREVIFHEIDLVCVAVGLQQRLPFFDRRVVAAVRRRWVRPGDCFDGAGGEEAAIEGAGRERPVSIFRKIRVQARPPVRQPFHAEEMGRFDAPRLL